jgi:hypothetical protein
MCHAPVNHALADNVVAASIATQVRHILVADNLFNLVSNESALRLAECLRVVEMPAEEAPHLLVFSIPIPVAVTERLVGQLAGDADKLALQGDGLARGRDERFLKPGVLLLPVIGRPLFSSEGVKHSCCDRAA